MAPPQLSGDTPVSAVVQPVEPGLVVGIGDKGQRARLNSLGRERGRRRKKH